MQSKNLKVMILSFFILVLKSNLRVKSWISRKRSAQGVTDGRTDRKGEISGPNLRGQMVLQTYTKVFYLSRFIQVNYYNSFMFISTQAITDPHRDKMIIE